MICIYCKNDDHEILSAESAKCACLCHERVAKVGPAFIVLEIAAIAMLVWGLLKAWEWM